MTVVKDAAPQLVTIRGVEIVSTGTFDLASGTTTFTSEDLVAAINALDDPAVPTPRLKLGHTDPRFDGEPALGKVENMELSEDKQTIIGDLVGVPRWLADVMPTAYPNRSIEGLFYVTTATGKTHQLVITALSLLGIMFPGVATLEDLPLLFSDEMPEEAELVSASCLKVEARVGGSMTPSTTVAATVAVEDVRRAYYDTLGPDQQWWWIRAIMLDPNELIVDDDDGSLMRVPFEVKGEEVTFGDAKEVRIEYVDVPNSSSKTAAKAGFKKAVAIFASREQSRPDTNQEVPEVKLADLRASLGMPDDATEEQVKARIKELRAAESPGGSGPDGSDPDEAPDGDEEPEGEEEEEEAGDKPGEGEEEEEEEEGKPKETTAKIPEGMKLVDEGTLEELKAGAKKGTAAHDKQVAASRKKILDDAISAGKFPPARRAHYAKLLAKDPKGTKQFIDELEANAIPVHEAGGADADFGDSSAYPEGWLPEVQARNNGSNQPVTQEV